MFNSKTATIVGFILFLNLLYFYGVSYYFSYPRQQRLKISEPLTNGRPFVSSPEFSLIDKCTRVYVTWIDGLKVHMSHAPAERKYLYNNMIIQAVEEMLFFHKYPELISRYLFQHRPERFLILDKNIEPSHGLNNVRAMFSMLLMYGEVLNRTIIFPPLPKYVGSLESGKTIPISHIFDLEETEKNARKKNRKNIRLRTSLPPELAALRTVLLHETSLVGTYGRHAGEWSDQDFLSFLGAYPGVVLKIPYFLCEKVSLATAQLRMETMSFWVFNATIRNTAQIITNGLQAVINRNSQYKMVPSNRLAQGYMFLHIHLDDVYYHFCNVLSQDDPTGELCYLWELPGQDLCIFFEGCYVKMDELVERMQSYAKPLPYVVFVASASGVTPEMRESLKAVSFLPFSKSDFIDPNELKKTNEELLSYYFTAVEWEVGMHASVVIGTHFSSFSYNIATIRRQDPNFKEHETLSYSLKPYGLDPFCSEENEYCFYPCFLFTGWVRLVEDDKVVPKQQLTDFEINLKQQLEMRKLVQKNPRPAQ